MSQAFVPGLQVARRVKVRRLRELPVPGKILVSEGQQVQSKDVVAQAALPGELYILRVPEKLGIEPFEVMPGLQVAEGDIVKSGQILCEHSGLFGLFKNRYLAPCDGEIEFVAERTGHIGLRLEQRPIQIEAYITGRVAAVEEAKSVAIESEAVLIQGIFGVGGERHGKLKMLSVAPDEVLCEGSIPDDNTGMILVGGMRPSPETLRKAAETGAVAFVLASIDDRALKDYLGFDLGVAITGDEDISMTVIVTEGFGEIAMSERTLELLREFESRDASINGATQVRAGAVRPEIIVCHSDQAAGEASEVEAEGLIVGRSIRLIRVPYFGQRAEVLELPHAAERIETGAFARVLRARLESGEVVVVPRANVELV